jgi:hypothetical protein
MKANKKISTEELLIRYDIELRNILMEDLRSFRAKTNFLRIINQAPPVRTATAA